MRLGLGGADGRMGAAIQDAAADYDTEIAVTFDPGAGDYPTVADYDGALDDEIDVYMDFTRPDVVMDNVAAAAERGVDAVVGTTGWDEQRGAMADIADTYDTRILYGSNFSRSVNVCFRAAELFATHLDGFDAGVTETHHTGKVDAPSGTAQRFYELLVENNLWDDAPAADDRIGSTRVDDVPGTHTLTFYEENGDQRIRLEHAAGGTADFAAGALEGAEWLDDSSLAPGLYNYHDDVIFGEVAQDG